MFFLAARYQPTPVPQSASHRLTWWDDISDATSDDAMGPDLTNAVRGCPV